MGHKNLGRMKLGWAPEEYETLKRGHRGVNQIPLLRIRNSFDWISFVMQSNIHSDVYLPKRFRMRESKPGMADRPELICSLHNQF